MALYAGALKNVPVTRVVGTHLHPDHIGLAGWIAKKRGVKLWMTRGEMLTARAIIADISETVPDEALAQSRAAGWDDAAIERQKIGRASGRERGWQSVLLSVGTVALKKKNRETEITTNKQNQV